MNRKPLLLLWVLLCMVLAVATYLVAESWNSDLRDASINIEDNFQQLVHGVGIGATTKPTWCYINFDPRIDPGCSCIEWPIPGGYCYCPDHTGSISYISSALEMGASVEIVRN